MHKSEIRTGARCSSGRAGGFGDGGCVGVWRKVLEHFHYAAESYGVGGLVYGRGSPSRLDWKLGKA